MVETIEDRIQKANARLKDSHIGVAIEQDGAKLRLRATLPPRQGEGMVYQQRIYPDISATPEGVRQAESEAHVIRRNLDACRFNWEDYLKVKPPPAPKIVKEWLEAFEQDYFDKREKNPQSIFTWKTDYLQAFKILESDQPLTSDLIRKSIISSTQPDTRTRKRCCTCLKALARFAGIEIDLKSVAGKYNLKSVSPRDIADDDVIASWFHHLTNPAWQWVYGILATYGLRNHEVFRLDFELLRSGCRILHVLEGKTGPRHVWACYPEWFDEFDLSNVYLPAVNLTRTNPQLGNNITHYFARHKIPFPPYNLRHAWAIRTLEFGLDISLSAQQMGHSLQVHSELYHHWISDKHHQRAYDLIMMRADRPKAPAYILPNPQIGS